MHKTLAALILTGFASTSLATEFKRPGSIPKSAAPAERTQTYRVPGPVAASLAHRWGLIGGTNALWGSGSQASFESTGNFSGYCKTDRGRVRGTCTVHVFDNYCVTREKLNPGWTVEDIRISGNPMSWKERPFKKNGRRDCLVATFTVPVQGNQRHNFSIREVILKGPAGKSIEDAFRR